MIEDAHFFTPKQGPESIVVHLSNALQHPQSKEPVWAQLSGRSGEYSEEGRAEHPQAQEEFPAIVTREVAPWNLCAQVAEEESAKEPTLCFQIPRILRDLKEDGGDRWTVATRNISSNSGKTNQSGSYSIRLLDSGVVLIRQRGAGVNHWGVRCRFWGGGVYHGHHGDAEVDAKSVDHREAKEHEHGQVEANRAALGRNWYTLYTMGNTAQLSKEKILFWYQQSQKNTVGFVLQWITWCIVKQLNTILIVNDEIKWDKKIFYFFLPVSFSMRGSQSSRSSEGRELMQRPFRSGMVLEWLTKPWGFTEKRKKRNVKCMSQK